MQAAKANFAAIPADALMDYTQFAPPAVAARAMRDVQPAAHRRPHEPAVQPRHLQRAWSDYPLYLAGAELEHFYPISALVDGQGLNITVQSYNGSLDFGFIADRKLVPDVWRLTELLAEELRRAARRLVSRT